MKWTCYALIMTCCLASSAVAGPNADAKILLHLTPPLSKNICDPSVATPPCDQMITRGLLYPDLYFAFLVVADADAEAGVVAITSGLEYNNAPQQGVDIFSWNSCNTATIWTNYDWPASGGAALITWGSSAQCFTNEPGGPGSGVVAAGCYFYCAAYSADRMQIAPLARGGVAGCPTNFHYAAVYSCDYDVDFIAGTNVSPDCTLYDNNPPVSPLGYISFSADGKTAGYNPCASAIPVLSTTWSSIKTGMNGP
jgi:hypothetical protein